jgi:hypothetical protein
MIRGATVGQWKRDEAQPATSKAAGSAYNRGRARDLTVRVRNGSIVLKNSTMDAAGCGETERLSRAMKSDT